MRERHNEIPLPGARGFVIEIGMICITSDMCARRQYPMASAEIIGYKVSKDTLLKGYKSKEECLF